MSAAMRKYFFIHLCFFQDRNATIACVGQAHRTFQLFLHTESTLPAQTKTINIPSKPNEKKNRVSATLKTFCALLFLLKERKVKAKASAENKGKGETNGETHHNCRRKAHIA